MPIKAFPQLDSQCYDQFRDKGMDLRDYFAAQIIPSLIINKVLHQTLLNMSVEMNQHEENVVAAFAYTLADAMMKVREE